MKKLIKFSIAGLFLFLLGFTFQSCETTNNVNKVQKRDLASRLTGVWYLSTIDGVNATDAFRGTIPSVSFDFASRRVSGNGGCNTYNGSFTLIGNVYTPTPMVSTKMACPQPNQEDKFLNLLGNTSTMAFNNHTLQLIQNGRVVLEFTNSYR